MNCLLPVPAHSEKCCGIHAQPALLFFSYFMDYTVPVQHVSVSKFLDTTCYAISHYGGGRSGSAGSMAAAQKCQLMLPGL